MNKESDTLTVLRRIELLLTTLVKTQISSVLERKLSDDKRRELYKLTGKYTVREIVAKTGLSTATISPLWQRWEGLGLLVKDGKQYVKII